MKSLQQRIAVNRLDKSARKPCGYLGRAQYLAPVCRRPGSLELNLAPRELTRHKNGVPRDQCDT